MEIDRLKVIRKWIVRMIANMDGYEDSPGIGKIIKSLFSQLLSMQVKHIEH